MQTIIIKGELTDLNTYIKELKNHRMQGASTKQVETARVAYECKLSGAQPVQNYPVHIVYKWYCADNRKDIDNVAFAKKFINDGLVQAGVLANDSRRFVIGYSDWFFVDKHNPRVVVEIVENDPQLCTQQNCTVTR